MDSQTITCSYQQEPLLVQLCDWKGRFRKGMEGRAKTREETIRHERNVESKNHIQEECKLSHEREEVPFIAVTPVSNPILLLSLRLIETAIFCHIRN